MIESSIESILVVVTRTPPSLSTSSTSESSELDDSVGDDDRLGDDVPECVGVCGVDDDPCDDGVCGDDDRIGDDDP